MLWWNSGRDDETASDGATDGLPADRPKLGVAFGAGAARGWAHIGVIQRLVEAGVPLDVIAGTSIGALVGGCFAAGKLDALEEFARTLTKRRLFSLLDFAWRGGGLITGEKLRQMLEEELGETSFRDLDRPFVCIATELLTGHEIWLQSGKLSDAVRASYALPGIFKPIHLNGQWLIDGAVVNPIPVSACRAMGARLVVAVNVSTEAFGGTVIQQPEFIAAVESAGENVNGTAGRRRRRNAGPSPTVTPPGISAVLVAAFNISQDRLARSRLAGDPPDVTIVPRTVDVGLFDFDKAGLAVEAGREAAERALPEIGWALEQLEQAENV